MVSAPPTHGHGKHASLVDRPPRPPALEALDAIVLDRLRRAVPGLRADDAPRQVARRIAPDVVELSAWFTNARDDRVAGYLSRPPMRSAYLGWFLPMNVASVATVLAEALPVAPSVAPLRVLDLGAGPLTASIAAQLAWSAPVQVTAVDASAAMLREGEAIATALGETLQRPLAGSPTLHAGNLRHGAFSRRWMKPHDVVFAAFTLNEWGHIEGQPRQRSRGRTQAAGGLVEWTLELAERCVAPGGALVLVEPGTRQAARTVATLRDAFAADPRWRVTHPCTEADACPLAHPAASGWCHATRPWQPPALHLALAQAMRRKRDALKFSRLVVRRADDSGAPERPAGWRIVSDTMRDGRALRRYACGPGGLVTFEGPAGTAQRSPLVQAWRGDRLVWAGAPAPRERRRGRRVERTLPWPRGSDGPGDDRGR